MWGTGQQRQCHCAFSRSGGQRFAPGAVAARREGAGNIAGELRKTDMFSFLRVIDAGHMVPLDQPENALAMLNAFTANTL